MSKKTTGFDLRNYPGLAIVTISEYVFDVVYKEGIMTVETLLVWLIVGLIAGWLAGLVVRGGGFGLVGDIVIGILGAIIGSLLFGFLRLHIGIGGILESIIVAFVGAVILTFILRAVSPVRKRL